MAHLCDGVICSIIVLSKFIDMVCGIKKATSMMCNHFHKKQNIYMHKNVVKYIHTKILTFIFSGLGCITSVFSFYLIIFSVRSITFVQKKG